MTEQAEQATAPEPATAPEGSPPTGDTPAQGNDATPESGGKEKPDYDPKSFGAGIQKGKAEAAKTIEQLQAEREELHQRLSKFEDADKTAEQLKAERDELNQQLATFREREAQRLAAAKADAESKVNDWPDEAKALVDFNSATDADALRKQVESIQKLVAKATAAPKPVPGGKAAPANTPSIDLSAWEAAKKSGDITRWAQERRKLEKAHGVEAVNAALSAKAGK